MPQVLKPYEPTLRDDIAGWIAQALGGDDRATYQQAQDITSALEFSPLGLATAGYDIGRAFGEGDWLTGGIGTGLMALPAMGAAVKPVKKWARELNFSRGTRKRFNLPEDIEEGIQGALTESLAAGPKTVDDLQTMLKAQYPSDTFDYTVSELINHGMPPDIVAEMVGEWEAGGMTQAEIISSLASVLQKEKDKLFTQSPFVTGIPEIDEMIGQGKPYEEVNAAFNKMFEEDDTGMFGLDQMQALDDYFGKGPLPKDAGPVDDLYPNITGIAEIDESLPYLPKLEKSGPNLLTNDSAKAIVNWQHEALAALDKLDLPITQKMQYQQLIFQKTDSMWPSQDPLPSQSDFEDLPEVGSVPWFTPLMAQDNSLPTKPIADPEILAAFGAPEQVFYTGYTGKFDEFRDPSKKWGEHAIFASDKPNIARSYGSNLYPIHLSMKNPFEHDWKGGVYSGELMDLLIREAKRGGHDSAIMRNMLDVGSGAPQTQYLVFSNNQVRSVWAKFDPAKFGTPGLMSGLAGAAILPSVLGEEDPLLGAARQLGPLEN